MIDAVFIFGAMNVLFEFILLSMLPPRIRCRVLGSDAACVALHFTCLALNLVIHWGTLVGTMSGIFSFICSIVTVHIARVMYGTVRGTTYRRGLVPYAVEELR